VEFAAQTLRFVTHNFLKFEISNSDKY
jgi:hypothetical protein